MPFPSLSRTAPFPHAVFALRMAEFLDLYVIDIYRFGTTFSTITWFLGLGFLRDTDTFLSSHDSFRISPSFCEVIIVPDVNIFTDAWLHSSSVAV